MRRKTWLPVYLIAAVLAASCGNGSAPPPAAAPQAEAEVPSTEAPSTPAGASTTTTTTTTPTTTTPTVVTTTTVPSVTVTSVPEASVSLDDGALVPADEYTPPTLPVPVLPVSASDVPWGERERLSAGVNYFCDLHWRDDTVKCWYRGEPFRPITESDPFGPSEETYDGWGEPSVETPEGRFVAVDAAREAACGLRPSGVVECWGAGPLASVPPPEGEFVAVSVGIEHACALRPSGQAECWGTSSRGVDAALSLIDAAFSELLGGELFLLGGGAFPLSGEFTSISASEGSVCGLRQSGEVECWGSGYRGSRIGDQVPPSEGFKAVEPGGGGDVCGLRLDNSVECWGSYDVMFGENQDTTYLLPPEGEFESISLGVEDYACGLRPGGEVECWSKTLQGEAEAANSPPEGEKFIQVEVGWEDACGVRVDNTLLCWWRHSGRNYDGELNLLKNVLQLEIVRGEACALFVDGTVQCFSGPLKETESPSGLTSLSLGIDHACGLRSSGVVECWGSGEYGKATPPGGEFTEVAASVHFTCGLRVSGVVECWGGGAARWHNKVVAPREPLVFIDTGWEGDIFYGFPSWGTSCGLREDGSLLCWGIEMVYDGSLLLPPEGVFVDVGVGMGHACALSITKEVKCWGWWSGAHYTYGEKNGRVERFDSLEVGRKYACGLKSDETVECWDLHSQTRILSPPTDHNGSERRYSYISAGYFNVCGIRTGTEAVVDCWGTDPLDSLG